MVANTEILFMRLQAIVVSSFDCDAPSIMQCILWCAANYNALHITSSAFMPLSILQITKSSFIVTNYKRVQHSKKHGDSRNLFLFIIQFGDRTVSG